MRSIAAMTRKNRVRFGNRASAQPWHSERGRRVSVMARGMLLLAMLGLVPTIVLGGIPDWIGAGTGHPLALIAACLLYAVLLAVPFVPSVEIGLLIMVAFGKPGAIGAWLATLVGLNLAYGIGRFWVRRRTAGDFALPDRVNALAERLGRHLPAGWVPVLALAGLLNLPGNTALGGGGGIAMLYSATRTLTWPAFAITTSIATAALPLLFLIGLIGAEQLVH